VNWGTAASEGRGWGNSARRAAVAGHGVVASTGTVGARGALGWCQGEAVSCKPVARERVLAGARPSGRPAGGAGIRRGTVGTVQEGGRREMKTGTYSRFLNYPGTVL